MASAIRSRELIRLPTGTPLEVSHSAPVVSYSDSKVENKVALCLHPWSWLGGNIDDPVLDLAETAFLQGGYHVLCYNSRGVGRSEGSASFTGNNEASDLQVMIDYSLKIINNIKDIVILGYSHGSLIASRQSVLPPPVRTHHILLSYPLSVRGWLTCFSTKLYDDSLKNLIQDPSSRVLIVYGDRDNFTGAAKYAKWRRLLMEGSAGLTILEIPGANHFWRGSYGRKLHEALLGWIP